MYFAGIRSAWGERQRETTDRHKRDLLHSRFLCWGDLKRPSYNNTQKWLDLELTCGENSEQVHLAKYLLLTPKILFRPIFHKLGGISPPPNKWVVVENLGGTDSVAGFLISPFSFWLFWDSHTCKNSKKWKRELGWPITPVWTKLNTYFLAMLFGHRYILSTNQPHNIDAFQGC